MRLRNRMAGAVTAGLAALALALGTAPAGAAGPSDGLPYAGSTGVGVHNAYEKAKYPYFADALDSGAAMLELDVWTNFFGSSWRVSHNNPFGNDNNCENATTPAQLRTKARNQNLAGCLSDIRSWHDAHPGHRPVVLKLELKDGFAANLGRGPADLDALLTGRLGDAVYRPGLLAAGHPDLDTAARAGAWPSRAQLAGKFIVELIPGTVEEGNSSDTLWTDREYATHLRSLAAQGRLGEAAAFPAVHRAEAGDPRARYADASLRPWFVVFDGDASAYAGGSIDTAWYDRNHYLVIATDAHNVAPAIDATRPTEAQARDRLALLAGHHASIVSADWYPLPQVLATVVPRG
ncbi:MULTISPECIES: phosphatidylinositol-specific phospholipase C domain-containing protein [unclassified Streptomyces]|uniref:phosphatidylinositol-specific phospholipase C domain-containing protein n=1 Tax=unclassified Streptomyces TaxID=2593676 RepID=UPI00224EF4F4|nr:MULTISPECIES: phosphatidylinositol-specific phospholipase C domain-containing protein [unclassified Streptomyces]MCX5010963.1 Ca2+-dependent phosphoinositide-specific phospholipase C [Streptomyces sp. NBC_00555]MCX5611453.1 Ca2+-dependent phosphoinositide-specific phospholipase C [Streptomyces sp. NBC_00047]